MPLSRTSYRYLIKIISISALIIIIALYALSRSLNYAKGPEIDIFYPQNGSTATSTTVSITGQALRVNKIFLNGNPIFIDENGYWKETIILFSGLNKITVSAEDQFGRKIEKKLDLVGPSINQ